MKILIADDHGIVRRGTRELLTEAYPAAVFVEADNGEAAVTNVTSSDAFDLAIVDLSMPGRGGLDAVKVMRERAPRLPIVVLSQHAEPEYAVRALRAGARGYVTKDSATEELTAAARAVLGGRTYVSAALAERMVGAIANTDIDAAYHQLSDREMQVLRMLGSGRSIKEIAEELALSDKTASTYRRRILDKLKLQTTADLIRYALKHKLAD